MSQALQLRLGPSPILSCPARSHSRHNVKLNSSDRLTNPSISFDIKSIQSGTGIADRTEATDKFDEVPNVETPHQPSDLNHSKKGATLPKPKTPILRNASNSINAPATASRGNPSSDVSSRRVLPLVDRAGGSQESPTLPTLDAYKRHLKTFGPRARAGNLSARVQE